MDEEDLEKREALSAGGIQQTNFVNESGLYALVFGSTKPEAKRFKRWVTSEVLPAIRKTGGYGIGQEVREALFNVTDQLSQLAIDLRHPVSPPPPPSRAELKARYDRSGAMDYRQAVQPLHLEYGQAWTTTLAMAHACDLNHPVFVDKVRGMIAKGTMLASEYSHLAMSPAEQWGCMLHGYQLSESGFEKVIAFLETLDLTEVHRMAIRAGAEALRGAFAGFRRQPVRGRPAKKDDALVSAVAELGQALSKVAATINRQGGQNHG